MASSSDVVPVHPALCRRVALHRNDSAIYATKNLERMRAFFRFCEQAGWVKGNPATPVKAPRVKVAPTLPFSAAEMERILDACDSYPGNANA